MVLGATFEKMAKVDENRTIVQRFGYILGSWGVWLEALGEDFGRSWRQVLLDDLGVKLGTSWQDVGTKMAEDGLRWPT